MALRKRKPRRWRDVPFGAIQLEIFELTKIYLLNNPNIDYDSSRPGRPADEPV